MRPVEFNVEEIEINDAPRYVITLDDFPATKFIVGEVKITENEVEENAKISYTYEVLKGPDSPELSLRIGDFLVHCLSNGLRNLPIAFIGGT